jgi:FlaA1/EpsC-like NDP-sugar epimerase
MYAKILAWPRVAKGLTVMALDVTLSVIASWLAFSLRLDVLHWPEGLQWRVYALAPVIAIPVFVRFGLYRAIFRYTGQSAMLATACAAVV